MKSCELWHFRGDLEVVFYNVFIKLMKKLLLKHDEVPTEPSLINDDEVVEIRPAAESLW